MTPMEFENGELEEEESVPLMDMEGHDEIDNLRPDFWTKEDVGRWLKVNGFHHLIHVFEEHDITGELWTLGHYILCLL